MDNHFGRGLMKGIHSKQPMNSQRITGYCDDFKRGYVIGYTHHLMETTHDTELASRVAGCLTRQYGLDKEAMIDIFTEYQRSSSVSAFVSGYAITAQSIERDETTHGWPEAMSSA
ncbi:DUF2623 family protein [Enterobacillus tribolii]|uniref:Uncharacterized protein DUF2623 n=1 Tax=Enterobacillus tribolii TaxID=1487935 RepID=A0A370QNI3_9GAMM|nr:DUF2623 family protein [Enterobacillus tribolii]MBW7982054.1 DUF2623 family protein [Enterobacillus tribolii]RDK89926.1 uncharacterized protein DUF2623 [Enterobacillus tribolii]